MKLSTVPGRLLIVGGSRSQLDETPRQNCRRLRTEKYEDLARSGLRSGLIKSSIAEPSASVEICLISLIIACQQVIIVLHRKG